MSEHAIEVIPGPYWVAPFVCADRNSARATSALLDVVAGFLTVHAFHTIYAADHRIAGQS